MNLPALDHGDDGDAPSPAALGGPAAEGWRAALALELAARDGATYLARRRHVGPLVVQRAFFPEGPAVAHLYVLHPPGGMVAGDRLALTASIGAGAHGLITTPAAGKVYRSGGATATLQQHFTVRGRLEWFPQETIVFDGARAALGTRVDLVGDARFAGWEIVCLGRPAAGESFTRGACRLRFELYRDGTPLVIDRTHLEGGGALLAAPFGMLGQPVLGTMLLCAAAAADPFDLVALRAEADAAADPGASCTVTQVEGAVVARYLGPSAARARQFFAALWAAARPQLFARPPCPPRIWLT